MQYKINPRVSRPPASFIVPGSDRVVALEQKDVTDERPLATQADLKALFDEGVKDRDKRKLIIAVQAPQSAQAVKAAKK